MEIVPKLLIVGFGKVAQGIAMALNKNVEVIGIKRNILDLKNHFNVINADIFEDDLDNILKNTNPDYVLYSIAADEQTPESYQNAYVNGLRNTLKAAEKCLSVKHIFFLSSTRVYGQKNINKPLTEFDKPIPADFGGQSLYEGEELANLSRIPTTIIRLSGIYGHNRNYLIKMAKDSESWPLKNRWTNRINEEDVVGFFIFLLNQLKHNYSIASLYLLTDNEPATLYDVLNWIRVACWLSKIDIQDNLAVEGKKLKSALISDLPFTLKYPNYISGYGMMLKRLETNKT